MVRKEHGRAEERRMRIVTRDSELAPENNESEWNRLVDNSTPSPLVFRKSGIQRTYGRDRHKGGFQWS